MKFALDAFVAPIGVPAILPPEIVAALDAIWLDCRLVINAALDTVKLDTVAVLCTTNESRVCVAVENAVMPNWFRCTATDAFGVNGAVDGRLNMYPLI